MNSRLIIMAIVAIALLGVAVGGGTLLGRSLDAGPLPAVRAHVVSLPSSQVAEGRFPLNFQGILLDENGDPVSNSSHSVTFAIYDDETVRGVLWNETQTVFTLDGLFTVELGVEKELDPSIFSENPETFLGIRIGRNDELTPRIRLAYAPYAIHALTADNVITPAVNPRRIALKRWYQANQAEITVAIDDAPSAVAFDGENIWVATRGDKNVDGDDNITKIRPSDGTKQVEIPVESQPVAIAFDGRYLWVVNQNDESLTRVKPDGSSNRRYPVDGTGAFVSLDRPVALTFDGENIWVADQGSDTVIKVRAFDGELLGEVPVGNNPSALAFDGEFLWVAHSGVNNLSKIDPEAEEVVKSLSAGDGQAAIAFDGLHMWVVDRGDGSVTKVRVSDSEVIGTFDVGNTPVAIVFDGEAMWVVNSGSNSVTKLRVFDGEVLGIFKVGKSPVGIAFDGANIWISNQDNDTVEMK